MARGSTIIMRGDHDDDGEYQRRRSREDAAREAEAVARLARQLAVRLRAGDSVGPGGASAVKVELKSVATLLGTFTDAVPVASPTLAA